LEEDEEEKIDLGVDLESNGSDGRNIPSMAVRFASIGTG